METVKKNDVINTKKGSYVVTDPIKKTVKRIASFDNLEDLMVESETVRNGYLGNMYKFLREKDEENTSRRADKVGNWIICRGYKITFDEDMGGVAIYDMNDYARHCEEFDNPCPSPKEVWDFIDTYSHKKKKEIYVPVTTTKLEEKEDKHYSEKREDELTLEELDLLRNDLRTALTERTMRGIKFAETAYKFIPNRKFNHRLNKILNAFWATEITPAVMKREVFELLDTHKFEEQKKVVRKFVELGWYTITELTEKGSNVEFVTKTDGRFVMPKSEFLSRYLLSQNAKYMPQIWRLINGFITKEQFIEEPIVKNDAEAKYIDFNVSCLRVSNEDLFYACKRTLLYNEEPNPLNILYKNQLKSKLNIGDFVEVEWKDYHTFYEGKVLDFVGGVRVRYEDGAVIPLYKHQEFEITSRKA